MSNRLRSRKVRSPQADANGTRSVCSGSASKNASDRCGRCTRQVSNCARELGEWPRASNHWQRKAANKSEQYSRLSNEVCADRCEYPPNAAIIRLMASSQIVNPEKNNSKVGTFLAINLKSDAVEKLPINFRLSFD